MSGHSKWSNIQYRKGRQDQKRGKIFTKIIRELTIAARIGGGDPLMNPRLRLAIDNALSNNMPKDTMERAIKRGAGGLEGENVEEIVYEGYGPAGVAVMVKCLTDNRNRTVAEVRHAFTKMGGNLGSSGSVSYLFTQKGQIIFEPGINEDKVMEVAINAGAEDVIINDDKSIEVIITPDSFSDVKDAMLKAGLEFIHAEVAMLPSNKIHLDKTAAEKMLRLIDMLEDLDDVQDVYSNSEISEEVLKDLTEGRQ